MATTTQWPAAARLAVVLLDLGISVSVVCPSGNPALALPDRTSSSLYSPRTPVDALERAIKNSHCDLIIACDDRVVRHLHTLHAANPGLRQLIERSIGAPCGYAAIESRVALLQIATAAGLRVPQTHAVPNRAALPAIAAAMPFPWIMKADRTWGGAGILRVDNLAQARFGIYRLGRLFNAARALHQFVFHHNPYPLFEMPGSWPPQISVQRYVDGEPVTLLATSWQGDVLAAICAEVLATQRRYGASTVVRLIDQPEMLAAAGTIAGRLGLSGFFGLDFVVEHGTGSPYLIELNPRTTQLSHLRLGPGHDLLGALVERAMAHTVPPYDCSGGSEIIALFPDAVDFGVDPQLLASAFHDIPSSRPELVRRLTSKHYSIGGTEGGAADREAASRPRAK